LDYILISDDPDQTLFSSAGRRHKVMWHSQWYGRPA